MPEETDNNLSFTKLTEANIEQLAAGLSELHNTVHKRSYGTAYWYWRYLRNPIGKTSTIVATRDGKVVGSYSIIYMPLVVQGKRVTAGLMADLSIDPGERSWQCLRGLLQMSLAECLKDKLTFGFGYSTKLAAGVNQMLGGLSLGRIPVHLGFINMVNALKGRSVPYPLLIIGWLAQPIIGLRIGNRPPPGPSIQPIANFGGSFDKLWSDIEKGRVIAIVKDAAYLNWRYIKCPFHSYRCLAAYRGKELDGFIIFREAPGKRAAFILELMAYNDNPDTMRALLLHTVTSLKTLGIGLVSALFPPGSAAAAALARFGFKPWGGRFWNMEMIIMTDRQKQSCPESELGNWDFSLGDWLFH
jgi:hypothetical protein